MVTVYAGQYGPDPFINRRGDRVPTAEISVYELGTATLAPLYTDRDRTASLANPLPTGVASGAPGLDPRANGIFYAEPDRYTVTVRLDGTVVYTGPIVVEKDPDEPADASGVVVSIDEGHGIDVDATDPENPVVAVDEAELGVTADLAAETATRAAADSALDVRVDALEIAPPAHAATHGDGGSDEIAIAGEQITSGTVSELRIPATIARDTEVTNAVAAEATLARNADNLTGGTVADARIPATITRDTELADEAAARAAADLLLIPLAQKGAALGVAPLDSGGKVDASFLPSIVISDFLGTVASQAAMLALVGQRGDWAIRSDLGTTWVVIAEPSSSLANWKELPTPTDAVLSVDGRTGIVTLSDLYDPAGAAAGAQAFAIQRGNHTGTQAQSTVTNLVTDLAAKQPLDSDLTALASAGNSAVLAATTASFLLADETKLDGIEPSADVTDAANVAAAGAVMEADTSTAAMAFVIDEDNMASNSATKVPTQQSVKAYVDASGGGGGIVEAIVEGANIDVDATDPANPIVAVTGLGAAALSNDYEDLDNRPTLGTAAATASTDYATAAQGATADSAVQPGDLAPVATSGVYADLTSKPTLGTAAATASTDYATAAQGATADAASSGLAAHLADTSDAHDASAISYAGGTGVSATDVEGALDELATEKTNTTDKALGPSATAAGAAAAAFGTSATAAGDGALALGAGASAPSTNSTAIGASAATSGANAVALGINTDAVANGTALGTGAQATGANGSVAIGGAASAPGSETISIGANTSGADGTIAIGSSANASGSPFAGIAIGFATTAAGQSGIAMGYLSSASGAGAIAIGSEGASGAGAGAVASAANAIAIGGEADATAASAIAIGRGVQATHAGGVAIGRSSAGVSAATTATDDVVIGTSTHNVKIPGTLAVTGAVTIPDDTVTLAKMANLAQSTIIGRAAGAGTGDPTALTPAQVRAIVDPTRQVYIPASAMVARTTGGSVPTQVESATNTLNSIVQDFADGATTLSAEVEFEMPADYNGGTFTVHYDWQVNATSGTVVWQCAARGYTDGQTFDQALGTAVATSDAATATANQHLQSAESSAVTAGGSPAAGCMMHLRFFRDPTNGSDNLAATARLRGVMVTYTRA